MTFRWCLITICSFSTLFGCGSDLGLLDPCVACTELADSYWEQPAVEFPMVMSFGDDNTCTFRIGACAIYRDVAYSKHGATLSIESEAIISAKQTPFELHVEIVEPYGDEVVTAVLQLQADQLPILPCPD